MYGAERLENPKSIQKDISTEKRKKKKKKQQANASLWQINEVLLLRKNMIYLSMNIKCF